MACPDYRVKWTWDEGVQGENGEWTERPALVLTRGTTKRRLRRHSLASSVGSGSASITSGLTPGTTRATATFSGSLPRSNYFERSKLDEALLVTLEDVKAIAIGYISTHLLETMKTSTAIAFDEFYRTEAMNTFLWTVLLYYNAFVAHKEASEDGNIKIPGVLGEEARKTLKTAQRELVKCGVNLGKQYSELNVGLSHKNIHHSLQGCLRASRSHRDQHLYEVVYEFAMFVTWITFGYKGWSSIHKELGRLFKTQAFNRDMKIKGEAMVEFVDELGCNVDKRSDEYLSYRVFYDRPPQGNLKDLHSPALVNYFPSTKERNMWAFEPPYCQKRQQKSPLPTSESPPERLGVIGELMSKVNPETLGYKEEEEEEEDEEEEDEDEDEEEEGGEEMSGEEDSIVSTTSTSPSPFTHNSTNPD